MRWSQSLLTLGEGQGTPRTSRQSIAEKIEEVLFLSQG